MPDACRRVASGIAAMPAGGPPSPDRLLGRRVALGRGSGLVGTRVLARQRSGKQLRRLALARASGRPRWSSFSFILFLL